jgi:hypothetical protein
MSKFDQLAGGSAALIAISAHWFKRVVEVFSRPKVTSPKAGYRQTLAHKSSSVHHTNKTQTLCHLDPGWMRVD